MLGLGLRIGGRFIGGGSPPPFYDADAEAYLTAIAVPNDGTVYYASTAQEITGAEIWTGVNNFFVAMKDFSLYSEIEVARLCIGGTATAHKWNAVNPLDTNAAHRATFFGGGVHSATGYQLNGTNAYANGHWGMIDLGLDTNAIYAYQRLNIAGFAGYMLGSRNSASTPTQKAYITTKWTDNNIYLENNNTAGFVTQVNNAHGLTSIQRISSSQVQTSKNATLNAAQSLSRTSVVTLNMFEGAINNGGSPIGYGNNEICFIGALKRHLSSVEHTNFYNTIQELQISLHREV